MGDPKATILIVTKKIVLITAFAAVFALPLSSKISTGNLASWYGGGEALNKHTANGEVFNARLFTCASWDYPFGTRLKVTNVGTGKSIIVRVNDRGPNRRLGRAIDLSRSAFSKIADPDKGLALVEIKEI